MPKTKNAKAGRPPVNGGPPPLITFGSNPDAGLVMMMLGPVNHPESIWFTFTPDNADQLAASLMQNAEKARGKKLS